MRLPGIRKEKEQAGIAAVQVAVLLFDWKSGQELVPGQFHGRRSSARIARKRRRRRSAGSWQQIRLCTFLSSSRMRLLRMPCTCPASSRSGMIAWLRDMSRHPQSTCLMKNKFLHYFRRTPPQAGCCMLCLRKGRLALSDFPARSREKRAVMLG